MAATPGPAGGTRDARLSHMIFATTTPSTPDPEHKPEEPRQPGAPVPEETPPFPGEPKHYPIHPDLPVQPIHEKEPTIA
jgi:hypothetical protein